jgi:phage gp36-like protein
MTATTQKPRTKANPRKAVSDVKHVEVLENGAAAFELALEDGAGIKLSCAPAVVMKLVSRLASHALIHAADGMEARYQPDVRVAYEAGKGRVKLTVAESGSGAGFQLILSNSAAEEIARDLLTAAQMSVSPPLESPVKP